jgi:predicted MFS family arabinose efflux permease
MILSGVGVGLYEGATDALLLDLHDCNQSRYVSLNHMFVTVGSALIAVFLLVLRDHWRPAVTAAGVATLTLGWFFHRAAPPPCPRPDAPFWPQLRAMPNKGLLAALFAVMTLAVGVELGTLGYLDSFLAGARGFSAAGAKLGLLLFLGGIATGRLAAGVLGGDARIVTALGTLLAMTTAAASALYFVAWRPAVLPLCFLIGLTVSATAPLLISLAGLLGGRCAGAAIGAIKVAIPFGGMALPFAVSQLASDPAVRTGWQYLPFPLASLGALAAAMALKSRLDKVARGGNAP